MISRCRHGTGKQHGTDEGGTGPSDLEHLVILCILLHLFVKFKESKSKINVFLNFFNDALQNWTITNGFLFSPGLCHRSLNFGVRINLASPQVRCKGGATASDTPVTCEEAGFFGCFFRFSVPLHPSIGDLEIFWISGRSNSSNCKSSATKKMNAKGSPKNLQFFGSGMRVPRGVGRSGNCRS